MHTSKDRHRSTTTRRDQYFLDKVASNDAEIERIREYIAPRIGFLNRNKGIINDEILAARKTVNECSQRIRDLKQQNARILSNARR